MKFKTILLFIIIFFLTSCGYKPSTTYTKEMVGNVSLDIDVSLSDPENSVLTKEAIKRAILFRLKGNVVAKNDSTAHLKVFYQSINFVPLQYDDSGYVQYYQARTTLLFEFTKDKKVIQKDVIGLYAFPIQQSAIISSSNRFDAIEEGSKNAIDQFVAYMGVIGAKEVTK
ncbi:MAG: hypothetical protein KN64_05645 [Sulfurovum sp. AS07-7]|nr:MAG: hypothetical protein KN64_05645 [Sulfurovum sp. AS07-7]